LSDRVTRLHVYKLYSLPIAVSQTVSSNDRRTHLTLCVLQIVVEIQLLYCYSIVFN